MKRLSLALATIGLSAATLHATAAFNVTVPQLSGGLVVGATGLLLEPGASHGDLDYASVNNNNSVGSNGQVQTKTVEPGFDLGFGVNLGYIFRNTGNDVNLSYWHLNTNDSDAVNAPGGNNLNSINFPLNITNLNFAPPFTTPFSITHANSQADFRLNQVDLVLGQYINVGSRLELHPFAGLRYAGIKRTLSSNYSGFNPSASANLGGTGTVNVTTVLDTGVSAYNTVTETSDFDGIGPVAGINLELPITGGLGLQGAFSGALLVGDVDSKLQSNININTGNFSITFPGSPPVAIVFHGLPGNGQFSFESDSRRIIPNMDASLGAYYRYTFSNQSDLTLGVNYQAAEYWNAVDRLKSNVSATYVPVSFVPAPITVNFQPTFATGPVTHKTGNLFVQGVTLSLTYRAPSIL
jgi:hypothetical protein